MRIIYFKTFKSYEYFLKKYLHNPYEWAGRNSLEESLNFFHVYEKFFLFIESNILTFGDLDCAVNEAEEYDVKVENYKEPKLQIE